MKLAPSSRQVVVFRRARLFTFLIRAMRPQSSWEVLWSWRWKKGGVGCRRNVSKYFSSALFVVGTCSSKACCKKEMQDQAMGWRKLSNMPSKRNPHSEFRKMTQKANPEISFLALVPSPLFNLALCSTIQRIFIAAMRGSSRLQLGGPLVTLTVKAYRCQPKSPADSQEHA